MELPHPAPRLTDMRGSASKSSLIGTVIGITILTLCMLSMISACGPQARPSTSSSPAASVAPVITTTAASAPMGYLEGRASIGPLQPVERVGVPSPTPSPAVCTARGLVVFDAQTGAEAARFDLGPDCTYRVALPPGSYRVELQRRGIDISKDLPQTVTISAGQTTRLDISIDTGIR
jgi:hypothetical protein